MAKKISRLDMMNISITPNTIKKIKICETSWVRHEYGKM